MSFFFNESNTFCINLETKPDRWERMQERFKYFDLKVTRWNAATQIVDNFPFYLNFGQKSCAQSHINIWRHMIEKDLDYALILEDDACFDKEWRTKLNKFSPNDGGVAGIIWDAIFLNASEPIDTINEWVCTKNKEQYLTAGYILSKKGSQRLLNDFKDCFFSSDWMTSRLQLYGNSYSYFPWLIIQEGKDTSIGSNLEADHNKVLSCLEKIGYSIENYI